MRINTVGATYLLLGAILAAFVAVLVAVVWTAPASVHAVQGPPEDLLQPVVALIVLTAIVTLPLLARCITARDHTLNRLKWKNENLRQNPQDPPAPTAC